MSRQLFSPHSKRALEGESFVEKHTVCTSISSARKNEYRVLLSLGQYTCSAQMYLLYFNRGTKKQIDLWKKEAQNRKYFHPERIVSSFLRNDRTAPEKSPVLLPAGLWSGKEHPALPRHPTSLRPEVLLTHTHSASPPRPKTHTRERGIWL